MRKDLWDWEAGQLGLWMVWREKEIEPASWRVLVGAFAGWRAVVVDGCVEGYGFLMLVRVRLGYLRAASGGGWSRDELGRSKSEWANGDVTLLCSQQSTERYKYR